MYEVLVIWYKGYCVMGRVGGCLIGWVVGGLKSILFMKLVTIDTLLKIDCKAPSFVVSTHLKYLSWYLGIVHTKMSRVKRVKN